MVVKRLLLFWEGQDDMKHFELQGVSKLESSSQGHLKVIEVPSTVFSAVAWGWGFPYICVLTYCFHR